MDQLLAMLTLAGRGAAVLFSSLTVDRGMPLQPEESNTTDSFIYL